MNEFEIINLNCIDDVFEVKSKDKNKQSTLILKCCCLVILNLIILN